MNNKNKRKYTWIRDATNEGDHFHNFKLVRGLANVVKVDLRPQCPPVYDQGELGSCTANAIAGAYQFDEIKQKEKTQIVPSRLFIYYNERIIEGDVSDDAGAQIRTSVQSVTQYGACPEAEWPYNPTQFAVKPPPKCYHDATYHKATSSNRVVQSLAQMKQCLIEGYPFVIGFEVYESFESDAVAQTGQVPMPKTQTEQYLGGHAVMVVGFNDKKKVFIVRNSWGTGWGDNGYCYVPYAYYINPTLASDLWTVRTVVDTA